MLKCITAWSLKPGKTVREEKKSGTVVNIRSSTLAEEVVTRVGVFTICVRWNVLHKSRNARHSEEPLVTTGWSSHEIAGKLKSPKRKIGALGYLIVIMLKQSNRSAEKVSAALGAR